MIFFFQNSKLKLSDWGKISKAHKLLKFPITLRRLKAWTGRMRITKYYDNECM